ncbi:FHA modulated ABC efflux pump with fused ATPase and integral [Candidatus Moduliflexus flocculans]|uniref:FHA modulated ABC efflux pump with fused ATPase and integral n=1 Tax=Candidatus Moduliflexus flocculans TaxID=1499966 RepID=A0A081BNT8_9BACT|nr:FHA modulated ABC efflux pump with fused ATPase and integral [Candidatus Moduliflexus flocculans]
MQISHSAIRLDAEHISGSIAGTPAFTDISLSIHPGEFVGILGTHDAGKTALLQTLSGITPAQSGAVLLNGINLYEYRERFNMLIGYVFQKETIHQTISVYDTLYYAALIRFPLAGSFWQHAKKETIMQRVGEVLRLLKLEELASVKIKRLSIGQRKQVMLGVELLTSPPLLCIDEPFVGLNAAEQEQMTDLLHKLAREGRTIILATQQRLESLRQLDLIAMLAKGQLVFYGPPQLAFNVFKVKDFPDLYEKIEKFAPEELSKHYRSSPVYKKYIAARLEKRYKTERVQNGV